MRDKEPKDTRKETSIYRFFHDDRKLFYIILIANILCIVGIGYCIYEDIRLNDTPSLVSACISETALILFVIFHIRYWNKKDTDHLEKKEIDPGSNHDAENGDSD